VCARLIRIGGHSAPESVGAMKQYLIQIKGPTFACRVLVNAGEGVPVSVIEGAVLQAVQEQQLDLAQHAVAAQPMAPTPAVSSWGLN
jgi:hypothetical protein